jgi:hypothetical protein
MKLSRHNLVNALIAVAAATAFIAFVALAEGGNDKGNRVAAGRASTTTTLVKITRLPTSTTTPLATTTTVTPVSSPTTLSVPHFTPTTAKRPTGGTTATTVRTTTPPPSSPHGQVTENTDNTASFSHGSDGSFSVSATNPPPGADPFTFTIKTEPGADGVNGETASVKFVVTLRNNTSHSVGFPGGLKITVTLHPTGGGADLQFTIDATSEGSLAAGEGLTISQTRGVTGYGSYDANANCVVDYG